MTGATGMAQEVDEPHPPARPVPPKVEEMARRPVVVSKLATVFGVCAVAASIAFLSGTFVFEELLARAFFLGAFFTAIVGAVFAMIVTKVYLDQVRTSPAGVASEAPPEYPISAFSSHYRSIFDLAPVPMLELDDAGRVLGTNVVGGQWLAELHASDEGGSSARYNYLDGVPTGDWSRVTEGLRTAAEGNIVELRHGYRAGAEVRSLSTRLVSVGAAMFGQPRLLAIIDDVTDAEQLTESLVEQARSDSLTGLVNRREFEQRLDRVLATARADGSEHAICYLDLDRFKEINDACGHRAGDELLRQLALRLQSGVRRRDTLARIGGDEFGVLMERCTLQQAERVAEALLQLVSDFRFAWADNTFSVGVSIGVVSVTAAATDVEAVLNAADSACYLAKSKGRNRVQVGEFATVASGAFSGERQLLERVRRALDEDRFELWSQEIRAVQPDSEEMAKALPLREVYLRLPGPGGDGELLPPGAFLPIAQRYGLGAKIDNWVLRRMLAEMARRQRSGGEASRSFAWSVNVSLDTLTDSRFITTLTEAVKEGQLEPGWLCFEVKESDALSNLSAATRFAEKLRDTGCRLTLEGVGGGPASFLYLQGLQPDYVKIDGVLISGVVEHATHRILLKAIVDLARTMNVWTVGQLIENEQTEACLIELGVDFLQGHLVSAPQPLCAPVAGSKDGEAGQDEGQS